MQICNYVLNQQILRTIYSNYTIMTTSFVYLYYIGRSSKPHSTTKMSDI